MSERAARRMTLWEQTYDVTHATAVGRGMSEDYADRLASRKASEAVEDLWYREEQQRTREAKANV